MDSVYLWKKPKCALTKEVVSTILVIQVDGIIMLLKLAVPKYEYVVALRASKTTRGKFCSSIVTQCSSGVVTLRPLLRDNTTFCV